MNLKVSIIIPCYNSEKWIEECIFSALNQTYKNTEVIVVDNESSDNSYNIMKNIQKTHPGLIVSTAPNLVKWCWEDPVGEALSLSSGDYFTILGSDDFISEDYVENIVKIISANPDRIKLLQTPIMTVRENEGILLEQIKHTYKSFDEFKQLLFQKCPVTTPSMVYSKKLYEDGIVRWNSKEWLGAADYDLYFNIADHGLFIYPYPKWIGYHYRWNKEQSTWGMHKETVDYDSLIRQKWKNKWKTK